MPGICHKTTLRVHFRKPKSDLALDCANVSKYPVSFVGTSKSYCPSRPQPMRHHSPRVLGSPVARSAHTSPSWVPHSLHLSCYTAGNQATSSLSQDEKLITTNISELHAMFCHHAEFFP